MHSKMIICLLASLVACGQAEPSAATADVVSVAIPERSPPPPAAPKKDNEKTVLDVALGSPDHTTLVAAVKAAGLADALNSPGGIYTVFAPNNEAFAKLPAGTVDSLLLPENKDALKSIIKHHAAVPIVALSSMKDGQVMSMSDGTKVTLHVDGEKVRVDDANIIGTVQAMNGVVYVVDAVVLPPKK